MRLAGPEMPIEPTAFAVIGDIADGVTERGQRVECGAHFKDHVAAIGSAAQYMFFLAEMNHAVPAFSGFDFGFCLVDEHGLIVTESIWKFKIYGGGSLRSLLFQINVF
jgi:hypothetical protein